MTSQTIRDLSVIIPVHNGGHRFEDCLTSVLDSGLTAQQVIVVADGESDGSWRTADALGMRVIRLARQGGPARARNRGAEAAGGDILLFIDADVTLAPDAPHRILSVFSRHPEIAAVIGSYDNAPAEPNFLSQYKNLFHHYTHQVSRREAATFWGACGAIRREVFLEAGGFDERYRHPSIEDIELGYRLKRAGYHIRLDKNIFVKHLKRWGPVNLLRADFFFRALPWSRLILRDGRFLNDLNLTMATRISVGCVALLLLGLAAAALTPAAAAVSLVCAAALVALNWRVYRFFWKSRGAAFTLKAIPWHWFYLFYSGLAYGASAAAHYWTRCRAKKKPGANDLSPTNE